MKSMSETPTLQELTTDELEAVNGGLTASEAFTCNVAGGLAGALVGLVAGGFSGGIGIVAGVVAGAGVKVLCENTI